MVDMSDLLQPYWALNKNLVGILNVLAAEVAPWLVTIP